MHFGGCINESISWFYSVQLRYAKGKAPTSNSQEATGEEWREVEKRRDEEKSIIA